MSGKVISGSKSGQRYLTESEEEELVSFILETAKIGFPRTRKEVLSLVQIAVNQKGKNVTVSSGWWEGFKKRHSEISLRTTEQLANNRAAACTLDVLSNYFDLLEQTVLDNDLVSKPNQIFNCDETGMPLNPKFPKGIVAKGIKHPRAVTTGNKTQMTVLACCNAAGYCLPPFVLFDRKCLRPAMCDGEVPGTMYGLSDSGWITSELFDLWFVHHFLPHAPAARPLLLLLDGHSSHYNPSVISKAAEEKVIIFCLPPHSSHETQPLDKGPFGPLKTSWKEVCRKFLADNPGKVVSRFTFSKLFGEAWMHSMTLKNIQAGFKCTGIYPLKRDMIVPLVKDTTTSTLAQRTGLKFIPLYSPVRQQRRSAVPEFTQEEELRFQRRFEEGYDIDSDNRYNSWKEMHQSSNDVNPEANLGSPLSHDITLVNSDMATHSLVPAFNPYMYPSCTPDTFQVVVPVFNCQSQKSICNDYTMLPFLYVPPKQFEHPANLQRSSTLSKVINEERPVPFCKLPVIPPKHSGKVLTSEENLRAIEEKERKKQEELRKRDERKEKRSKIVDIPIHVIAFISH